MRILEHADHSQEVVGVRGEDIHKWIDGFFDSESFDQMLRMGKSPDYDPYDHRKYRHCTEALEDALEEFKGKYTPEQIKGVFECHIKDDYDGYLPRREDFENGTFAEIYHEDEYRDSEEEILNQEELYEYFKGKKYSNKNPITKLIHSGFNLRILFPTVIAIVLFVTSIFWVVIPVFRKNMMDRKKEMIKELTATAESVIRFYVRQAADGRMTVMEAKKNAAEGVGQLRYGSENKDYFWITDMGPKMIMHPYRPDLIGKDLSDYRDQETITGKRLFMEFVNIVKQQDEGYVEYLWQWKDDKTRTVPKLSYVKGFPQWSWIVGTGIYINDVEEEIDKLTERLFVVFLIITFCLVVILASVVMQSRRIEDFRLNAEVGLREVKDRYRALVEAANEGYILELDGVSSYANHTLKRMIGFNDEELSAGKVWELFISEEKGTDNADKLKAMLEGDKPLEDFEAQVKTSDGIFIDVIISISKIFFSNKNGHVIKFRPIMRTKLNTLFSAYSGLEASVDHNADLKHILEQISSSSNMGIMIQSLNNLSSLIREMTEQGAKPETLRKTVGSIFDTVLQCIIKFALEEEGEPPVPFVFITLGSNARHEMTMFSDQDNALIYEDVSDAEKDKVQKYFLALAHSISSKLNQAGYPYCPGGIMAANPKWCKSVTEWKEDFASWIVQVEHQALMDIHVFYDIYAVFGNHEIVNELFIHIQKMMEKNTLFIKHFARNCLTYTAPIDLFGKIKGEKHDGVRTVSLKECLKPVETFARIYALKNSIPEPGTAERLFRLHEMNILTEDELNEIIYIFDYLWTMRFYNQLHSHEELKKVSDDFDLDHMTEIERTNLRNVLTRLNFLHERISLDFLGNPLYMSRAQE
ncbi:MAG: DUF294 nucleotidyltransferase-like domain-containing protein [Planctomycetota bacterium]|jgi:PAS domain S-box-containing protein